MQVVLLPLQQLSWATAEKDAKLALADGKKAVAFYKAHKGAIDATAADIEAFYKAHHHQLQEQSWATAEKDAKLAFTDGKKAVAFYKAHKGAIDATAADIEKFYKSHHHIMLI